MIESAIITSGDLEFAQERIRMQLLDAGVHSTQIKRFMADEFKVEDAKAVIKEAYIAEEQTKYLLLVAKGYNIYAQNALLKLLEEPPRNILFFLFARSKTSLLPTIRSRLQIRKIEAPRPEVELGFTLKELDLALLFDFVKRHSRDSREEVKEIIQKLLKEALLTERLPLKSGTLERFEMALHTAELHARPQTLLSGLLLELLEAKRQRPKR